jgi:tartrate-resistant acid phosphatase type 5
MTISQLRTGGEDAAALGRDCLAVIKAQPLQASVTQRGTVMTNFQPTRRQTLQGLGALGLTAAIPLSRAWADAGGASLNFLAVGDWGREGKDHQRDVAARMAESAKELGVPFVISVGDNFYEDGVTSVDDPTWHKSFEDVYDQPSLQIPWYVILGNHDYHANSQAQLDYARQSSRWHMPARWYKFAATAPDHSRIEFFVVDTSPMMAEYYTDGGVKVKVTGEKKNVPVQLAWLDKALTASRADWKIVIGHHPIYSGKQPDGSPDLAPTLDPILQKHKIPLYLNGHDHDLQHVVQGKTHYVCTGAGSLTVVDIPKHA